MHPDQTSATAPTPVDFADPEAFALGEWRRSGATLSDAIGHVRQLLDGLSSGFGVTKVQFWFNGTPAVMSVHDAPQAVHADWQNRRDAYQQAADSARSRSHA